MSVNILIPYIHSENDELRYVLRAIEENLKFEPEITIIGDKPEWLDTSKVNYMYYGNNDVKHKNTLHCLDIMCLHSDEFFLFHDDFFVIKPLTLEELKQTYYLEDFNNIKTWKERWFVKMLKKGYEEIKKHNLYGLNYATHTPLFFNSKLLRKVIYDVFKLFEKDDFVAIENYYYNYIGAEKWAKPVKPIKVGRYNSTKFKPKDAEDKIFLNFDEAGIKSGIFEWVKDRFSIPSKYEKDIISG